LTFNQSIRTSAPWRHSLPAIDPLTPNRNFMGKLSALDYSDKKLGILRPSGKPHVHGQSREERTSRIESLSIYIIDPPYLYNINKAGRLPVAGANRHVQMCSVIEHFSRGWLAAVVFLFLRRDIQGFTTMSRGGLRESIFWIIVYPWGGAQGKAVWDLPRDRGKEYLRLIMQ